jgi:hypothetical protein
MTTNDVPYHVADAQQDNSTVAMLSDFGIINKEEAQIMFGILPLVVENVDG